MRFSVEGLGGIEGEIGEDGFGSNNFLPLFCVCNPKKSNNPIVQRNPIRIRARSAPEKGNQNRNLKENEGKYRVIVKKHGSMEGRKRKKKKGNRCVPTCLIWFVYFFFHPPSPWHTTALDLPKTKKSFFV